MLLPYPLADISQLYPLWNYIPHNSVLWVGMRMGIIGMATFWALMAMIVLEGIRSLRSVDDPLLRGAAAFAVAAVLAELVVGYADVQLEAYRNMIFFGVMVGLIDALPRLRAVTVARLAAVPRPEPLPALRPGTAMPTPRLAHPARSE
jgi:O-antigen ligase